MGEQEERPGAQTGEGQSSEDERADEAGRERVDDRDVDEAIDELGGETGVTAG